MTRGDYDVASSATKATMDENGSAVQGVELDEKADTESSNKKPSHGYGFQEKDDQSMWLRFKLPLLGEIRFNPVVSFFSILLIWGFVGWCIQEGENVPFVAWKKWIVANFTWLYIGSQDIWAVFAVVLYCSKYANLRLGKDHEKPEYNDVTWFVMLFACGIGVGLFFYGVAEPIFHYTYPNRYTMDPTTPDNTLSQIAINVTLYHWGIHGWIVYCLVGLLLGLMSYRENLPMTMKSCFYPLIGDRIFGWMGDAIDIISVMTTLFGVCTSLGLGTRQLNTGFNIVNPDIDPDKIEIQVIIIWCITAVATISTVSGIGMGIRRLSEICFGCGMFLMMVALFSDQTFYILNLFVQSIGYYFQFIIQLGWHTDAFEQLGPSAHKALGRFIPEGKPAPDGPEGWIDDWTMFYWGWWISWSPFVGMFIAKISKGRTIRQFINGTLTAPVVYSFMWMVIFGGAGLRHEREASVLGYCCKDAQNWFLPVDELATLIAQRSANDTFVQADASYFMCDGGNCGPCARSVLNLKEASEVTYAEVVNEYAYLGVDFGSTDITRRVSKLSCHRTEQMWFDVMRSYDGIGPFLSVFSLIAIVLYFVTSSDSGSLVIDCLSSNGDPDPPRIQRVFWALTEGATATALLVAGGKEGLTALQTAGIVSGLPYTFIICLLCVSLWRAVQVAAGDMDPHGPDFAIGLFDPLAAQPMPVVNKNLKKVGLLFKDLCVNLFTAPWTVAKVAARMNNSKKVWPYAIPSVTFFLLFILFHFLELACSGCWAIAWFFYLCFATMMASVRIQVREHFGIVGNPFEDFFAALFLYPNTAVQMDKTTENMQLELEDEEKGDENLQPAFEKTDNAKDIEGGIGMANMQPGNYNAAYVADKA